MPEIGDLIAAAAKADLLGCLDGSRARCLLLDHARRLPNLAAIMVTPHNGRIVKIELRWLGKDRLTARSGKKN